ncbi:MAG: hypothetical protein ACMZ63_06515 [Methylotenera sp.]
MVKNEWVSLIIDLGNYISCFVFAMGVLFIGLDILTGHSVLLRQVFILISIAVWWLIVSYILEEVWWKTFLKLFLYSIALNSALLFLLGIKVAFELVFTPEFEVSLYVLPSLMVLSAGLYFGSVTALRSKLLCSR